MPLETQKVGSEQKNKPLAVLGIKRGLSRNEAAAFYGLSLSSFDKFRREGTIPGPTLPGKRYDLLALQAAMDKLSGISAHNNDNLTPLEAWRAKRRGQG